MIIRRCLICNPIHDMVKDEAGEWFCHFHGKVDRFEEVELPDPVVFVEEAVEQPEADLVEVSTDTTKEVQP